MSDTDDTDKHEKIAELTETTDESIKQLLVVLYEKYHQVTDNDTINEIFSASLIDSLFRVLNMVDAEKRNHFIGTIESLTFAAKLSKEDLDLYNLPTEGQA